MASIRSRQFRVTRFACVNMDVDESPLAPLRGRSLFCESFTTSELEFAGSQSSETCCHALEQISSLHGSAILIVVCEGSSLHSRQLPIVLCHFASVEFIPYRTRNRRGTFASGTSQSSPIGRSGLTATPKSCEEPLPSSTPGRRFPSCVRRISSSSNSERT